VILQLQESLVESLASASTSPGGKEAPRVAIGISTRFDCLTLDLGDIIATGTPEGVGVARIPPTFLQPGDVVRCEIDGIGVIENRIAAR